VPDYSVSFTTIAAVIFL